MTSPMTSYVTRVESLRGDTTSNVTH